MTCWKRWCLMGLLTATTVSPTVACSSGAVDTLTISAAADLTYAFQELGVLFEKETGTKVVFNFGSTGQLAQQIRQGAPVDVFAAANVSFIEELESMGLIIAGTKAHYARGFIVIWARPDSAPTIQGLHDLVSPEIRRIAIANPDHAPYGMAARQALQTAGLWEQIQPKLVLGENARQTMQYAESGNVSAAIVPLSLAMVTEKGRWTPIPQELYRPIDQALAVIKGTRHEKEARAFALFINSVEARTVMHRYGFAPPEQDAHQ